MTAVCLHGSLWCLCSLSPHRSVHTHTHHILPCSFSLSVRFLVPSVCSRMADQWLSAHAEWSTWYSWQSPTSMFSAHHCHHQSQSRDWTTSSSQPRSLTLVQTSTPVSSTSATPQLPLKHCLYAHVWRDTGPAPLSLRTLPRLLAPHSATTEHASKQLSISDLLQRCFSKVLSRRTVPLLIHGDVGGAHGSRNISSHSSTTRVPRTQRDCTPPRPRGLEGQTLLGFHTKSLQKQRPRASLRPVASVLPRFLHPLHLSFRPPYSPMSAPPKWDHIPLSPPQPKKGVLGPPLREPTLPSVPRPVLVVDHSQSPCLPSYHLGMATSTMQTVISCIINIVSRCFSGTRTSTKIIAATCGRFHAVIQQEASDHVLQVSDQFIAYTGDTDLAILLNRATFEPNSAVFAFHEASTSKDTWSMAALVVRGLLRRPSLSGTSPITFCSVHIHNVVAKNRDASTDLLRRRHAHMTQYDVDFIGVDFNMSAFSTVGDVFADPEFSAPGNSLLWGLGALDDSNRERPGFLIKPKRPQEWCAESHGCCKFNKADVALGPASAHHPLPGPDSTTRSEQAQQRRLNAKLPSMNVVNATGDSHNLQRPNVLVPPLRETQCVPLKTFTGAPRSYPLPTLWHMHALNTVTMKQVRAMLLNKIT